MCHPVSRVLLSKFESGLGGHVDDGVVSSVESLERRAVGMRGAVGVRGW